MTLIVNETVALDAGSLGLLTPVELQAKVGQLFLSHSHIDHIGTLPLFLDNVFQAKVPPPKIYATEEVHACLRSDLFNDRVWPDLARISREVDITFYEPITLHAEQAVEVDGLQITPVALHHLVPTMGFLLKENQRVVAVVSDTAPTARVWELLAQEDELNGVFLEASFPNSHQWLADKARHLTPQTFAEQIDRLPADVPVYAVHLKAGFRDEIIRDLEALQRPNVHIGVPGETYEF